jgi:cytosine deaminase
VAVGVGDVEVALAPGGIVRCDLRAQAVRQGPVVQGIDVRNVTFRGEEDLLHSRGVLVEVLQEPLCIELMRNFIRDNPSLWNEDVGT